MSASVGESASPFKALAYIAGSVREIGIDEYRGRWIVLFFYPGDFTCICPTELAAIAAKYPAFCELDCEVLAVSTDSPEHHARWNNEELKKMIPGGIRFPMLSDPLGVIGILYGVYDSKTGGHRRGRFIIDPEGIIKSVEVVCDEMGRSVTEILRQVRALRQIRQSGNLVPCGWEPGKPLLPSKVDAPGLSGKIWNLWKTRNAF